MATSQRQVAEYVAGECPTCGAYDDPETPFIKHLCSGMRLVPDDERHELPPEVRAELEAKLMEFDRCRARAAVEARSAWIG